MCETKATSTGNFKAKTLLGQPDGKLIIAGYVFGPDQSEFVFIRLNTDSALDAHFGKGGITRAQVGSG